MNKNITANILAFIESGFIIGFLYFVACFALQFYMKMDGISYTEFMISSFVYPALYFFVIIIGFAFIVNSSFSKSTLNKWFFSILVFFTSFLVYFVLDYLYHLIDDSFRSQFVAHFAKSKDLASYISSEEINKTMGYTFAFINLYSNLFLGFLASIIGAFFLKNKSII